MAARLMAAGGLRRWVGAAIVLASVAVAGLAPLLAPYDPLRSGVDMLDLPSRPHPFGTDDLGRDIISRVVYGARTSLAIGIGAASVAMLVGVPLGLAAGYFRGRFDLVVVGLIDLFIALPGLVLALIITAMVGPTLKNLILVLGFVMWPPVARLVRGQALAVRETPFVEAARAAGGTSSWIIRRHVWPNVVRVAAPQFAVTVAFAIFTSASLSFLGLGIPPPTPDWGGMVRTGYDYLSINPFMSLGPGAAVTLTVMGFYVAGASFE
jgi:peptide/nickel transport system permease protein